MARRPHSKMRTKFIHTITRGMFKRGHRVGHQIRGIPYRVVTSYRGMRAMKKYGYKVLDRDIRPNKDHTIWVCHWRNPGIKDDMWHPSVPRGKLVDDMTDHEMRLLRSPDKFKFHTITEDFDECKRLGVDPKIEPKCNLFTLQDFVWMKHEADKRGLNLTGYALIQNARNVGLMRKAGIPASYIRHR